MKNWKKLIQNKINRTNKTYCMHELIFVFKGCVCVFDLCCKAFVGQDKKWTCT